MVFCTECGTQIPENVNFCTACGKPATVTQEPTPEMAVIPPQPQQTPQPEQPVQLQQPQPPIQPIQPMQPMQSVQPPQPVQPMQPQQPVQPMQPQQPVQPMQPQQPVQPMQPQPPVQSAQPKQSKYPTLPANTVGTTPAPPPRGSRYAVIGTGGYIGMMILFGIPVIGWLVCIIMAFAAKNRNRRNYARAALILTLIGIAISVALYFVISWAIEAALDTIGSIESISDLFNIFNSLTGQ